MRLIDVDELGKEIEGFFLSITGNPKQTTVVRECKKSFEQMIEDQHTAFDLDKVVEQIRKATDEYGLVDYVNGKQMIAKEQVIEIVKKGGIE